VVVATEDINAGVEITEDMVKVMDLPESLLISSAIFDTELVVGQTTRVKVLKGEQIAPFKIGADPETEGVAGVLPAGTRAYSITVDEATAVGGLTLPGNRVDVYMSVYWDLETPNTLDDVVVQRLLMQDIEVLAVAQQAQEAVPAQDQATSEGASATSGQLPDELKTQPEAQTITLALTPDQVAVLACAEDHQAATVSLALRAFGEPKAGRDVLFDPCPGIVH
jgi:pilus assembly protein CpaB